MRKEFITATAGETRKMGELLAQELRGGEVLALVGDLGGGKTTFAQGLLKGLGLEGPHSSPTFVIMKHYRKKKTVSEKKKMSEIENVYHIDAYRVGKEDILNLGWEEIVADVTNVVIVEWADRIRDIMPKDCLWLEFEWLDEKARRIKLSNF